MKNEQQQQQRQQRQQRRLGLVQINHFSSIQGKILLFLCISHVTHVWNGYLFFGTLALDDNTMNMDMESSWIDPDTPQESRTTKALSDGDHRDYQLVFSDEFEIDGRRFDDGWDPRWTAVDKNDFTNNPLHYYSKDAAQTQNGSLAITLTLEPKDDLYSLQNDDDNGNDDDDDATEYKEFKSGMLQGWNKFCFTGGIVEVKAKMPSWGQAGLWPAFWLMGNLGRATYVPSTENVWPFSTNVCDERTENSQLINSCREGFFQRSKMPGMESGRGRGAPEIDMFEVMYMDADYFPEPVLSTSLQVAPGVASNIRPVPGQEPNASQSWYSPIYGENVTRNTYFYGTVSYPANPEMKSYATDSISANIPLTQDFYETFHTFRLEWQPPDMETGVGGFIQWFIDDQLITAIDGDDIMETSSGAEIPSEPMYLVMNLAVSKDWGFPDAYFKNCPKKCWSCLDPQCDCALPKGFCSNLPVTFEMESVRVYQPLNHKINGHDDDKDSSFSLGCSPPHRPTAEYIAENMDFYKLRHEDVPLKDVLHGGGPCQTDEQCGFPNRGHCDTKVHLCICQLQWTGPTCAASNILSRDGTKDTMDNSPSQTVPPRYMNAMSIVFLFVFTYLIMICTRRWKNKKQKFGQKKLYESLSTGSSKDDPESSIESHALLEKDGSYQHGMLDLDGSTN